MLKKANLCKVLITLVLFYSCTPNNYKIGKEQIKSDMLLKNLSGEKSVKETTTKNLTPVSKIYQITGKVEKGPFQAGSKITLTQLDDSLEKTDQVFHTKILDNQGSYFYEGKFKTLTPILVEVEGKYFDEVQNKISDKTLKLKTIGLTALNEKLTTNVNSLSSLQTKRLTELVKTGSTFSEAEEISQKEVLNVFGVDSSRVKKKLSEISLKESPDLLRISVILQGKKGNPKVLLDTIEKEIGENGKVVDKKTIATLQKNEKEADYKKVVANLKSSLSIKSNANPISLKKMKVDPAGGASVAKKTDKTPSNPRSDLEKINTFTVADIKGWDGITINNRVLPSSVSNPSFTLPSAHNGINSFLVTVSSVVKNDTTGIYQYTARVSNQANSVSKNFNIVYNTGFATISALLNTFTTADIKGWDGITINNRVLPSAVGNPNFTLPSAHNGISSFRITASSVSKNDTTGIYQYTARVSNQANSVSKNFNVVYNTGFATISSLLNTFTTADIKGWDGITADSSALPSSVSNPSFTLPSAHNGISSFLVTVSSVVKNDTTGIYQYTARVSNQANSVSKNFNIVYNTGFATISALLNTFTTADIKGWDGITINNRVLPSSVANPSFTLPSAHNGISSFLVTVSSVSKNDTTGIYQYTARVSNQANSVSKNFNVVYNTGFATISSLLNTFTTADIKGWDGLTPDSSALPSSVANPNFTLPSAHNGISSFRITASSVVKNDVRGTYQYTARVSNQANSVSKNFSIVYNTGFATVSALLNTFTTADIKGWDGVNLSASILPSSVANPNFTLPSAHNGISSFRVTASSVSKNDVRGTYQYTARISNQANSVSKNLNVVYSSGFATISSIFNTFTTADIKQWDGITPDSTVLPSSVSNPNFTTLPSQYKGITGFQIELDASSIKKTDALGEVEYDVILKDRNNQVRKAFTITYNTFDTTLSVTFKSIQDSSSKTYGRSPLSVVPKHSAITILSHATRTTCSTTENTILISSDNWTNCDAVYVKKGPNNNFILIPKEAWALNTTYKVGVRGNSASIVWPLRKGQSLVSFETSNSNHGGRNAWSDTGSLDISSSMASDLHTYGNKIYMRGDGYSFIFYYNKGNILPTKLAHHSDSDNLCSSYINYTTSGTGSLGMTTITNISTIDKSVLIRALNADNQNTRTYFVKTTTQHQYKSLSTSWTDLITRQANERLGYKVVQPCVYKVADRS